MNKKKSTSEAKGERPRDLDWMAAVRAGAIRAVTSFRRKERVNMCGVAVVTLAMYVEMWFLHSQEKESSLLSYIGLLGVTAFLGTLVIALVVSPSVVDRVMKIVLGVWALIATACAGGFVTYGWAAREQLVEHLGFLLFIAVLCLVSLGAALIAWVAFWRCKW